MGQEVLVLGHLGVRPKHPRGQGRGQAFPVRHTD